MTAEPSLFDKIRQYFQPVSDGHEIIFRQILDDGYDEISAICTEYEKRIADLEAANLNMASRLQKLMEKQK